MPHTAIATHNAIRTRLAKLTKLLEEYFFVRLLAKLVNVDVTDDTLLIDDEERAFRKPCVTKNAVFLRDVAVRPEIRK